MQKENYYFTANPRQSANVKHQASRTKSPDEFCRSRSLSQEKNQRRQQFTANSRAALENILQNNADTSQSEGRNSSGRFNYSSLHSEFQDYLQDRHERLRHMLNPYQARKNMQRKTEFKRKKIIQATRAPAMNWERELQTLSDRVPFYLKESMPRKAYENRSDERKKMVRSWPSREQIISHVHFLTSNASSQSGVSRVLFIGSSAPRKYLPYLASLFTHLQFIVSDVNEQTQVPPPTSDSAEEEGFPIIYGQLPEHYTVQDIYQFKNQHIMPGERYVSILDFSRRKFVAEDSTPQDQRVREEQTRAELLFTHELVNALHPNAAMLRLRVPYAYEHIAPLQIPLAEIFLPPWRFASSTEVRLIITLRKQQPDKFEYVPLVKYDILKLEEQLFFVNDELRTKKDYGRNPLRANGLRHDYDSLCDLIHLFQYLESNPEKFPDLPTPNRLALLNNEIIAVCAAGGDRVPPAGDAVPPALDQQEGLKIQDYAAI